MCGISADTLHDIYNNLACGIYIFIPMKAFSPLSPSFFFFFLPVLMLCADGSRSFLSYSLFLVWFAGCPDRVCVYIEIRKPDSICESREYQSLLWWNDDTFTVSFASLSSSSFLYHPLDLHQCGGLCVIWNMFHPLPFCHRASYSVHCTPIWVSFIHSTMHLHSPRTDYTQVEVK